MFGLSKKEKCNEELAKQNKFIEKVNLNRDKEIEEIKNDNSLFKIQKQRRIKKRNQQANRSIQYAARRKKEIKQKYGQE